MDEKGNRVANMLWQKIQRYYLNSGIHDMGQTIQDVTYDSLDNKLHLVGRHPFNESDILADYDEMLESRQSYMTEPCCFGPQKRRFIGFDVEAYETIEE